MSSLKIVATKHITRVMVVCWRGNQSDTSSNGLQSTECPGNTSPCESGLLKCQPQVKRAARLGQPRPQSPEASAIVIGYDVVPTRWALPDWATGSLVWTNQVTMFSPGRNNARPTRLSQGGNLCLFGQILQPLLTRARRHDA